MKKLPSVKTICIALIGICSIQLIAMMVKSITILSMDSAILSNGSVLIESIITKAKRERFEQINYTPESYKQEIEIVRLKASSPVIVFEGMTMEELGEKLDRSLNSSLEGYGLVFANYAIQYGVDPYLAVAIALHETGCTWTCSNLVQSCNNVGGMKGSGCGAYAAFESLDAGIEAMIRNLSENYIQKGLNTPETIGNKYAASDTWSTKIHSYINRIRNA